MKKTVKPTMNIKPMVTSVGTAFLLGASAPAVFATENPFGAQPLSAGYQQLAHADKAKEGKCGEAKCGADAEKATEGKCGGDADKAKEGKCGEHAEKAEKAEEGKCGEGKCGESDK